MASPLPSSSSVAKTPALVSSSGSLTFHSRVSASGSQRRLRQKTEEVEEVTVEPEKSPVVRSLPASPLLPSLPLYTNHKSTSKHHGLIYGAVAAYCLASVIFFTLSLVDHGTARRVYNRYLQPSTPEPVSSEISSINEFSLESRFSKLVPSMLATHVVTPFAYTHSSAGISEYNTITACLWGDVGHWKDIFSWTKIWNGPISIVLTRHANETFNDHEMTNALLTLQDRSFGKSIAIHLLEKNPDSNYSPNAYLNIARFFSHTRYVALFPSPAISLLSAEVHDVLQDNIRDHNLSNVLMPTILSSMKAKPHSLSPFPPLSPILLDQEHPIWCTERFFTSPSREQEWEECLWQYWLNSYGNLKVINISPWAKGVRREDFPGIEVDGVEEQVHRRLSHRYRHESCASSARRFMESSNAEPSQAQWLRKICRQVLGSWSKELL